MTESEPSKSSGLRALPEAVSTAGTHQRRRTLRTLLAGGEPVVLPGVTDALGVRLVERAGFHAAYLTGAGVANAQYGLPDVGLVSLAEVVEQTGRVTAAGSLPVVVDADTGYGGALSVVRTVQLLERAGAAGIQLEDQEMPKRCGHFDGQRLIPLEYMQSKIAAARAAREDEQLVLLARTDACQAEGIDSAIRRGHAYREAGADVVFVEAPGSVCDLERVGRELAGVPLVVNVVEGGKTPELPVADYARMGFTVVLYANFLMRTLMHAGLDALLHLRRTGETVTRSDRMAGWQERQELVRLPEFTEAERRFERPWLPGEEGTRT